VEPLPETVTVLEMLRQGHPGEQAGNLGRELQDMADRVVAAVPDCMGLSITYRDHDLTFTYLRTGEKVSVLDAVQYLTSGPCEVSSRTGEEFVVGDLLDEDRWQMFAQASASFGVRSSLSFPLRSDDRVIGSVNFYATTPNAFPEEEQPLARMFGAWVEDAVRNADLSMSTVQKARQAPGVLHDRDIVDQATGVFAAQHQITMDEALERLTDAAARGGTTVVAVAHAVVRALASER
jgi:GAF domain-containing protein